MKKLTLLVAVIATSFTTYAQIGIGTITPNSSAALDVTSTTSGFLPPRMTQAQRNVISTPSAGLIVYCTDCGANGELQLFNGTSWVNMVGDAAAVPIQSVTGAAGSVWMDRNLGATQVATSSTDAASYGDLYQWGRAADGHQIRTSSGTTATLSAIDQPAHGDFITINSGDYDWRSPQNGNLWQGVSGVNNPCPSGYRLPTDTELEAERASWGTNNNAAGAFGSPLKLPMSGYRDSSDGSLSGFGTYGLYWSSTVSGTVSRSLDFDISFASMYDYERAYGFSVRCIKE
jgi:uncharacterized protein (TIGR02145 family)